MIRTIHGRQFVELQDRTSATFQRGDVVRMATSINNVDHTYQYVRIMSERSEIRATRQRRGLPFHRVPSVLVTVRGYNGDPAETPENMREGMAGPYYIDWRVREGRDSTGRRMWNAPGNGQACNYDCWLFDTDERVTVWRPVNGWPEGLDCHGMDGCHSDDRVRVNGKYRLCGKHAWPIVNGTPEQGAELFRKLADRL